MLVFITGKPVRLLLVSITDEWNWAFWSYHGRQIQTMPDSSKCYIPDGSHYEKQNKHATKQIHLLVLRRNLSTVYPPSDMPNGGFRM